VSGQDNTVHRLDAENEILRARLAAAERVVEAARQAAMTGEDIWLDRSKAAAAAMRTHKYVLAKVRVALAAYDAADLNSGNLVCAHGSEHATADAAARCADRTSDD
jgi:hypothetical protein